MRLHPPRLTPHSRTPRTLAPVHVLIDTVRRTIRRHRLLRPGDRVLVALVWRRRLGGAAARAARDGRPSTASSSPARHT